MLFQIEPSWNKILAVETAKPYFSNLTNFLDKSYKDKIIYPSEKNIFQAFNLCSFDNLKVVIIGQDPYHGKNQAHGLAFSVPTGTTVPPSLKNIFKEIKNDLGKETQTDGNLERWAKQGILLLNSTLTVESGQPGSHQGLGWETFTDEVIKIISTEKDHVAFILWGKYAEAKAKLIDESKHLILIAPHPSPFSAQTGFFGCKHFSQTNEYLKKNNLGEIEW